MMTTVDIAICTYRRAHIADTMRSVAEMTIPADVSIRFIVADNDSEASAQTLVQKTADDLGIPLTYIHAPAGNISIARNACLSVASADFIAYIDDDQLVCLNWLSTIVARARETHADVVLGPVRGIYPNGAPRWLISGGFHDNLPAFVKGKLITGYTGSTLVRRASPAIAGLTFDLAYGVTGGEDTDFFSRAHAKAARIEYAPEAVVYEPVPASRMRLYWLIQRRIRYGETHADLLRRLGHPKLRAALAASKAGVCFLILPALLLNSVGWRYWLLRGVFHTSVARVLLQRQ